ncbi:hypothetical protein [Chitinasiproducens palmae]|uniref:Uncharacterized protein n=1 Tax=Chitinasiproducens palmae TaxID=1770053 RepID=A0A1H2PUU4_9BURK|nr:hypothetical protein [Chitinasiproducens palmae]SDV51005.1 hypothetical protein SAMN05216551_114102 [Chitinasiproducens palmae]
MISNKRIGDEAVSGSGTVFALRGIGLLLLVRWLNSMSDGGFGATLQQIPRSPTAILHLLFILLLLALPGAKPLAGKPFQPLPRWLRQTLRVLSLAGILFVLAAFGSYWWGAGPRALLYVVRDANGWPAVLLVLYAAVAWLCRARPLWRTRAIAGRFAVGRFAVALDAVNAHAVVWDQNRKVGQYPVSALRIQQRRGRLFTRFTLSWTSLAAAGHNRRCIIDTRIASSGERRSADALDAALTRMQTTGATAPDAVAAEVMAADEAVTQAATIDAAAVDAAVMDAAVVDGSVMDTQRSAREGSHAAVADGVVPATASPATQPATPSASQSAPTASLATASDAPALAQDRVDDQIETDPPSARSEPAIPGDRHDLPARAGRPAGFIDPR